MQQSVIIYKMQMHGHVWGARTPYTRLVYTNRELFRHTKKHLWDVDAYWGHTRLLNNSTT